jgi:hypothetical protein
MGNGGGASTAAGVHQAPNSTAHHEDTKTRRKAEKVTAVWFGVVLRAYPVTVPNRTAVGFLRVFVSSW